MYKKNDIKKFSMDKLKNMNKKYTIKNDIIKILIR